MRLMIFYDKKKEKSKKFTFVAAKKTTPEAV
jgi:hypothetical protein